MHKRLRLQLGIIIFLWLFFIPLVWPYQNTTFLRQTVEDTYINDKLQPEKRKVLSSTILSWPAFLTSYAHGREEHESRVISTERRGENVVKTREITFVSTGLNLGLDLSGGSEIRYRLVGVGEGRSTETAEDVVRKLRRRIDAYGLKEPIITAQGADRVTVQLPGQDRADIDRIKRIIEGSGHLEFRLVARQEVSEKWVADGVVPEGYHVYTMEGTNEQYLIDEEMKFSGTHIRESNVGEGSLGEPIVRLYFDARGVVVFGEVTEQNVGRRLAILLNDVRSPDGSTITQRGKLYSAPRIKGRIYGDAVIEGQFTPEQARDLVTTLRAGSLPAKLETEHEYTVGPTLGEDTIRSGTRAVLVGLILVLAFMAVYYMACGLVANFA
ncbi:MAG: hypothetical protein JXE06_07970, partial [Coriobacteriia bacterium]|nr:hypothetical protein [Coriobacteriia bacterium]